MEITQPGLRQMQVNPQIGLSFASAMRSFLRAIPMSLWSVRCVMRKQRTWLLKRHDGHLVFSTLHTNNAPETVTRLIDMGIEPFSFQMRCWRFSHSVWPGDFVTNAKEYEASDSERSEFTSYLGETALSRLAGTGPSSCFAP